MGRKVSILIRLACILIAGFFVSMPLSVSARRIMIPRYAVSEEEITALREEHSFLKYFPLEVVERRLLALKIFLNREDAGRVCAELLRYSSEDLEERARRLDAIEGLKVSYRNELSMLTVLPETVRDNLAILNANNIDHVKYSYLLHDIATVRLANNIEFLKAIGIDFAQRPRILLQPMRYLKNNYILLQIFNRPIEIGKLALTTEELLDNLEVDLQSNTGNPGLFQELPLEAELSSEVVQKRIKILSYMRNMLSLQEEFYKWANRYPEANSITKRVRTDGLFTSTQSFELGVSSYSLFSLMTYASPEGPLGKAVMEVLKIALDAPVTLSLQCISSLQEKYILDALEAMHLGIIVDREIRLSGRR